MARMVVNALWLVTIVVGAIDVALVIAIRAVTGH